MSRQVIKHQFYLRVLLPSTMMSLCLFIQIYTVEARVVLPRHFTLLLPLLQKILHHVLLVDDIFFTRIVLEINYVLGVCNKKMVQYKNGYIPTLRIIAVSLHELLPSIHLILQ